MSTVSLKKWGNSIGVRIPATFLKEAHLVPGEELEIGINEDGALILTPTKNNQRNWLEQFNVVADESYKDEIMDVPNSFDEDDWTW